MLNTSPETGPPQRLYRKKEIVVNAFAVLLSALLVAHPGAQGKPTARADGPVSITVGQPQFGFNVLPNSTRRIYATVTNGTSGQVSWSLKSGTATLSSNSGSWIDVVAGPTGTSCAYAGTPPKNNSIISATQFVVEAAAVDDPTQKFDLTFNVCNPAVQVSVIPFYRTLYSNQMADVQSLILGAVDQTVHWAITLQPTGGDGKLSDSTSRDTVFTGSVPGRYVLTATSNADPHKSSTAIMYVTGHAMPYRVTPNQTEPVDCTVDPAMLGKVYDVGPSQPFKTLASVPFPTMQPGSTVRLHNEDTTQQNPTVYHEYVQISQAATANQPFRMCGVPDAVGNLPIMDGENATGRSDTSTYAAGYGLVTLHTDSTYNAWPNYTGSAYIAVEGIEFRNAKTGFSFTNPDGSAAQWQDYSAGIRVNEVHNGVFFGNDIFNNGCGVFSAWNQNSLWGASDLNILWEGNHLRQNGAVNSYLSHQMYLQEWGTVVQFNRIEQYQPGAFGSNIKGRGVQEIFRYNYLGDGAARQMDLVDVQDAPAFMSFAGYMAQGVDPTATTNYPPDLLAAEQEAWNYHFVYGNIYQNQSSNVPIHFSGDDDAGEQARKGSLFWYNNTFYEALCPECSGQQWTLFDTTAGGGYALAPQVEWQTIQPYNNIIWMDDPGRPGFQWNNYTAFIGISGKNLMPVNWGTNDQTGGAGTGWSANPDPSAYQNATDLASHLTGFTSSNLVTTSAIPFDPNTWILKSDNASATAVPTAICEMPARFAYLPSLGYAVPRIANINIGATDTAAETATQMNQVYSGTRYSTHYSTCR
jgi:hypothetical protein